MVFAAIGVAATARGTFLAIDIGLDRTAVARFDVRHVRTDRDDFHAEFVSRNARVTEERHLPEVTGNIGSANADAMHAHQCFAGTRRGWLRNFNGAKLQRLFELNGFHD